MGRENEMGCIGVAVLSWIVANLEEASGIAFDEDKLRIRFPLLGKQIPVSDVGNPVHEFGFLDTISRPIKGLWRLMGRETRVPGSVFQYGSVTNESVHATARFRGYGRIPSQPAVPGYVPKERDGVFVW